MGTIFCMLDNGSLRQARKVSKKWQKVASFSWVWRHHFERDYYPSPYPPDVDASSIVKIGSAGIGTKKPDQKWERLYESRRAVEKRWRQGSAAAIYLTGHTDNVYCVQFDQ